MLPFSLCTSVPCTTTFQFQAFWISIYAYKHTCCHSNPLSAILDYIHYPLVFYCTYTFTSPIYPHVHFLHYMNYIITVHYIQIRKHIPPNNPSILHYMEYSTFHEDLFFTENPLLFPRFQVEQHKREAERLVELRREMCPRIDGLASQLRVFGRVFDHQSS